MKNLLNKLLRFLSNCLKTLWLFFPVILFIALAGVAFISLPQGQDVLLIAVENKGEAVFFVLAVTFLSFINWYTSRLIAYAKTSKNPKAISQWWLGMAPRVFGYATYLIVIIAIVKHDYFTFYNKNWLIIGLIASHAIIYYSLKQLFKKTPTLAGKISGFHLIGLLTLIIVAAAVFCKDGSDYIFRNFVIELVCIWILQMSFLAWNNVRRARIELKSTGKVPVLIPFTKTIAFTIPQSERRFFWGFNIANTLPLALYFLSMAFLPVALFIGGFNIVMLSFGVLVGFLQLVSLVSVRTNVNFHFMFWVVAILIGKMNGDPYHLRTFEQDTRAFDNRMSLDSFTQAWLDARVKDIDTSANGGEYPVYFVLSDGGASRSGYWVASALGRLDSMTDGKFSRHLFCMSGASGGSVGNGTFYALLDSAIQNPTLKKSGLQNEAKNFLKNDFLSFTISYMLGADFFRHVIPIGGVPDRSRALEKSMEQPDNNSLVGGLFAQHFSNYIDRFNPATHPILFINTTRVADGAPGVISNIRVDRRFTTRIDVLSLLDGRDTTGQADTNISKNINLSTAVCLGARFPYMSPAADINGYYFVDGGYFDNSGAGIVMEALSRVHEYIRTNPNYNRVLPKLRFYIIHLSNSDPTPVAPTNMSPLVNDLFTPLLTLAGTYSKQTNVNNDRLRSFVHNYINVRNDSVERRYWNFINLYQTRDTADVAGFSMNWVISDTTLRRMDRRLELNDSFAYLQRVISNLPK